MSDIVEAIVFEDAFIPNHANDKLMDDLIVDCEVFNNRDHYYRSYKYKRPYLDKRKGLSLDIRFESSINQWIISFGKYDHQHITHYLEITTPSKPTKRLIRKYSKVLVRQFNVFVVLPGYKTNKGIAVDSNAIPELQACKSFNYKEVDKIKIYSTGE